MNTFLPGRPARVVVIQDLSGFGRCSLTVILPILSAMGIQACPVPTAVLSTHTGGMGEVVFRDLTDYIEPALEHYRRLDLEFECVYSGFLGSEAQIDHCLRFFRSFPDALSVVDPVMGDHGKPYRTYTPEMRSRMRELVAVADLITPNLTEASILLGAAYSAAPITRSDAKSMLVRLSELGPRAVVVTGVELASGERMANIGFDRERSTFWCVPGDYVPVCYPGTGDIFASVLTGGLLSGDSLPIAMDKASRFTEIAIKTTYGYGTDPRHGVMLEKTLSWLTQRNTFQNYQSL